ncbi:MAG: hypothetical protein R3C56_17865 [Pirellulaceae bacterium]
MLVDSNGNGRFDATDQVFQLDSAEGTVVVGDFNGDGRDEPALHQSPDQQRWLEAKREGRRKPSRYNAARCCCLPG